jgi:hypothetical protein
VIKLISKSLPYSIYKTITAIFFFFFLLTNVNVVTCKNNKWHTPILFWCYLLGTLVIVFPHLDWKIQIPRIRRLGFLFDRYFLCPHLVSFMPFLFSTFLRGKKEPFLSGKPHNLTPFIFQWKIYILFLMCPHVLFNANLILFIYFCKLIVEYCY